MDPGAVAPAPGPLDPLADGVGEVLGRGVPQFAQEDLWVGTGKLSGPPRQAHADSFRHETLKSNGANRRADPKRTPAIRVRKRQSRPKGEP